MTINNRRWSATSIYSAHSKYEVDFIHFHKLLVVLTLSTRAHFDARPLTSDVFDFVKWNEIYRYIRIDSVSQNVMATGRGILRMTETDKIHEIAPISNVISDFSFCILRFRMMYSY